MTNLRIIHWNIAYSSDIEKIIPLLKSQITNCTIANLLEVTPDKYAVLKSAFSNLHISFSLDFRSAGKYETRNRKLGVCTISTSKIEKSKLITTSVFPERTLVSSVEINGEKIKNLAFHSLTGCDYKKAKSSNFASIASFISDFPVDIITCDMNEPDKDSDDINGVVFFNNNDKGKAANLLIGKDKCHTLNDSCRMYTANKSLSVENYYTHIIQKTSSKKRYDYIFINNQWQIKNYQSLYEESIKATSDHALILCDVEL